MKQWFVAHTQPRQEALAQQQLLEQGFDVYLPRFMKVRRHARKAEAVLSPLFPRYLFIGLDLEVDRWRSVNGTRGVAYLLTNEDRPSVVPTNVIQSLKAQENSDGLVPVQSVSLFIKGDKVRVLEGAFEGQVATFEQMDDKQRVQLLIQFLGREKRLSLSAYAVEAA